MHIVASYQYDAIPVCMYTHVPAHTHTQSFGGGGGGVLTT